MTWQQSANEKEKQTATYSVYIKRAQELLLLGASFSIYE